MHINVRTDTSNVFRREVYRFYDKSADWILNAGPRILFALLALFFGLWLIRIFRSRLSKSMARKEVHSTLRPFFESLLFTGLHGALFFLILQILGVKLTVFAAVIAAFGAAAGLALSGTLQNFASGILILLLKPFKIDDNIVAQGVEGTVTSIQIFYTIITTFDNKDVVMPNSKLSNEVITNITQKGIRRLDIILVFKHTTERAKAMELLHSAFEEIQEANNEPKPRIGVTGITKDDYSILCNVWVNSHGFEDSRLKINSQLLDKLHEAGIYTS